MAVIVILTNHTLDNQNEKDHEHTLKPADILYLLLHIEAFQIIVHKNLILLGLYHLR